MKATTSNGVYTIEGYNTALNENMKQINIELNIDLSETTVTKIKKAEKDGTKEVIIDHEDGTIETFTSFNTFVSVEKSEDEKLAILTFD